MKEKYYWFAFSKHNILVKHDESGYSIPLMDTPPIGEEKELKIHTIGTDGSFVCKSYAIDDKLLDANPAGFELIDLRASYDILPLQSYKMAGKASQILFWDKNTKYCPCCGVETTQIAAIGKKCPKCNQEFYPNISPAIIVRIHKGDSILLVHARNFRGSFKGLVAGFVEPGETLEEAVEREVMEETGLKIDNIRYFGSQPWPYPSGIMIGFIANYVSGEIKLQDEELSSGEFFTKDNLPEIPRKLSIARKLIDAWLEEE